MSLLRSLTRNMRTAPLTVEEEIAQHLPHDAWTVKTWVAGLSIKYSLPQETILCAIIEMTDMPAEQKLELQQALKEIRDGSLPAG